VELSWQFIGFSSVPIGSDLHGISALVDGAEDLGNMPSLLKPNPPMTADQDEMVVGFAAIDAKLFADSVQLFRNLDVDDESQHASYYVPCDPLEPNSKWLQQGYTVLDFWLGDPQWTVWCEDVSPTKAGLITSFEDALIVKDKMDVFRWRYCPHYVLAVFVLEH